MKNFYEKSSWLSDAKDYERSASKFATMATILGLIGLLIATITLFLSLFYVAEGRFLGIIQSIYIGFISIMIIVFGSVMKGLSKIVLAVFEMSVSENRLHMFNAEADKTE